MDGDIRTSKNEFPRPVPETQKSSELSHETGFLQINISLQCPEATH